MAQTRAGMKESMAVWTSLCLLTAGVFAAEPQGAALRPVTLTFYLSGMECAACGAFISQSINEVKSVTGVDLDMFGGYANVTFDPRVASAHQIAQAVTEAMPLHGKPYSSTLKLRVPDYAMGGNAAKVDAVFAGRKEWVEVEVADRAKGEFVVNFLPLKVDKSKEGPQGWNPGHFEHAISDAAPKGLGLGFTLVKEGQDSPAPKAAAPNPFE